MDTAGRIGLTHLPTINEAVLATDKALGHGKFDSMYDVVYIRPERYPNGLSARARLVPTG